MRSVLWEYFQYSFCICSVHSSVFKYHLFWTQSPDVVLGVHRFQRLFPVLGKLILAGKVGKQNLLLYLTQGFRTRSEHQARVFHTTPSLAPNTVALSPWVTTIGCWITMSHRLLKTIRKHRCVQVITVAKLPLWSSNKIILWLEGHHSMGNSTKGSQR